MMKNESIIDKLRSITNSDNSENIYDLGLIYDQKVIGNDVYLLMRAKSTSNGDDSVITSVVKDTLHQIPWVEKVEIDLVYDGSEQVERIDAEAYQFLGFI
jgi:metal-sulfur cluster biosynthetic enzyme